MFSCFCLVCSRECGVSLLCFALAFVPLPCLILNLISLEIIINETLHANLLHQLRLPIPEVVGAVVVWLFLRHHRQGKHLHNYLIWFPNTLVRRLWPKRRNGRAGNWEIVIKAFACFCACCCQGTQHTHL